MKLLNKEINGIPKPIKATPVSRQQPDSLKIQLPKGCGITAGDGLLIYKDGAKIIIMRA